MPHKSRSKSRLLPQVLEAVARLKETKGSTARKIMGQVKTVMTNTPRLNPPPRNFVLQVRRALRHGVDYGLLKERAGRYKLSDCSRRILTLNSKGSSREVCKVHSGKKTVQRTRRQNMTRRRCRRGTPSTTKSVSETLSRNTHTCSGLWDTSVSSYNSSLRSRCETVDKPRRRRPRGSNGRRQWRSRKSRSHDSSEPESAKPSPKPTPTKPTKPQNEQKPNEYEMMPSRSAIRRRRRRPRDTQDDNYPCDVDMASPDLNQATQNSNPDPGNIMKDYIN